MALRASDFDLESVDLDRVPAQARPFVLEYREAARRLRERDPARAEELRRRARELVHPGRVADTLAADVRKFLVGGDVECARRLMLIAGGSDAALGEYAPAVRRALDASAMGRVVAKLRDLAVQGNADAAALVHELKVGRGGAGP